MRNISVLLAEITQSDCNLLAASTCFTVAEAHICWLRRNMAEQQEFDVKSYTALIGLAEYFRSCQPPKIRECIHCLQASLNIGLPPILDAKVRLNIGNLLLLQTNNLGHARSHLQQAVRNFFGNTFSLLSLK